MVKPTHIKLQATYRIISFKTVFRYCFIFLITFVFALLKFSAFLYASQSGIIAKKHFTKAVTFPFEQTSFSAGVPNGPYSGEPDMEVMEEDEETKHKADTHEETLHITYHSDDPIFSASLKSRFLHNESALHKRQDVPFFVLYHSWKSYLS